MDKQITFSGQNIKAKKALRIELAKPIYPQNELTKYIANNNLNSIKN